jgi:hypothetical protein
LFFFKGGALYIENSTLQMLNSKITGCYAGYGGGIYAENSNVDLVNCTFAGNYAVSANGSLESGTLSTSPFPFPSASFFSIVSLLLSAFSLFFIYISDIYPIITPTNNFLC